MTDPLNHAGVLVAQVLVFLATVLWARRARRASESARASEETAARSARLSESCASLADALAPPDVIAFPFPPPGSAETVNGAPVAAGRRPRLYRPPVEE